jgi:hypothetical protein
MCPIHEKIRGIHNQENSHKSIKTHARKPHLYFLQAGGGGPDLHGVEERLGNEGGEQVERGIVLSPDKQLARGHQR